MSNDLSRRFRVPEWLSTNTRGFVGGIVAVLTAVTVDQVVLPSERARDAGNLSSRLAAALPVFEDKVAVVRLAAATTADVMLVGGEVSETKAALREFQSALRGYNRSQDSLEQILSADRILDESQDQLLMNSFSDLEKLMKVVDSCLRRAVVSYDASDASKMLESGRYEETISCEVYTNGSILIELEDYVEGINQCQNTITASLTEISYASDRERSLNLIGSSFRYIRSLGVPRNQGEGASSELVDWAPIRLQLQAECNPNRIWPEKRKPNRGNIYPWDRLGEVEEQTSSAGSSGTERSYEDAVAADVSGSVAPVTGTSGATSPAMPPAPAPQRR